MTKRCYVLGAGFSVPFGLPLACGLTQRLFAEYGDRPLKDAWLAQIRALYPACDCEKAWPDFEALVTTLDEFVLYQEAVNGVSDDDFRGVANLRKALPQLLWDALRKTEPRGELGEVQRFAERAIREDSEIVSFNWDLLLEAACLKLGATYSYRGQHAENGLKIAKPHGSLNVARFTQEKYNLFRDRLNIELQLPDTDEVVVCHRDVESLDGGLLDAIIVEPSLRKQYTVPWIAQQWTQALQVVMRSDEIVVIGYSLPPNDVRPRILLQAAGFQRASLPKVIVVNPDKGIARRFREYIRDVEAVEMGWIEWFNSCVVP